MTTPTVQQIITAYPSYRTMDPNAVVSDYMATGGVGKGNNTPYAVGGGPVPQVPKPVATTPSPTTTMASPTPTGQPATQPTGTPQAGSGPRSASDLIASGYYGYRGWGDTEALADFKATGGAGKGGPVGGSGGASGMPTLGAAPTIDIQAITNSAYNTPEIQAAQKAIDDRSAALAKASAEINDNPFYSEATRVGKQRSLTDQANNDIKVQQEKLATLKSDAAIKVNAATNQYNINNESYKQSLNTFFSLANAGGLSGASADDLSKFAISTGIPMSFLTSIQTQAKAKDNPPQLISSTDNSGQVTITAVDKNTGNIINQVTAGNVGKGDKPGKNNTPTVAETKAQYSAWAQEDAKSGKTLQDLISYYGVSGGLTVDEIYRIYNSTGYYRDASNPSGVAKETLAQAKQGQFSNQPGFKPVVTY